MQKTSHAAWPQSAVLDCCLYASLCNMVSNSLDKGSPSTMTTKRVRSKDSKHYRKVYTWLLGKDISLLSLKGHISTMQDASSAKMQS